MTNIHMKICLIHLAINKMLIQITVIVPFYTQYMVQTLKSDIICWQGYKARETLKYYQQHKMFAGRKGLKDEMKEKCIKNHSVRTGYIQWEF